MLYLPNYNRRFATDRGLYQHKIKGDPRHNQNKAMIHIMIKLVKNDIFRSNMNVIKILKAIHLIKHQLSLDIASMLVSLRVILLKKIRILMKI